MSTDISVLIYDADSLDLDIIVAALTGTQVSELWPDESVSVERVSSPREFHTKLLSKSFDVAVVGLHGLEPHEQLVKTGFLEEKVHIPTLICADIISAELRNACARMPKWTVISKSDLVPRLRDAVHYLSSTLNASSSSSHDMTAEIFPLIFGESSEGYMVLSEQGDVLYSNSIARKLLGRSSLNKSNCSFLFEDNLSVFEVSSGSDGEGRSVACLSNPVLISHQLFYVIRLEDITWHRLTEQQMDSLEKTIAEKQALIRVGQERISELEAEISAVGRAKDGFFASISHEIRTPLSSVIGYAEALKSNSDLDLDVQKSLSVILASGGYLLQLVNNALDISKLEAGKLQTKSEACCLQELVEDIRDIMLVRAKEKGLELNINYNYPIPAKFFSDYTRIKQVLCNLVGNAVKFTEVGSVDVVIGYDAAYDELVFEIKDSGVGVPETEQELIFEVYQQSAITPDSSFGGSGLGLPLSKQLAICLGGDVTFRPNKGSGSIFTCSIQAGIDKHVSMINSESDLESDQSGAEISATSFTKLSGRVLVVEDYEFTRNLAKMFLDGFGLDVVEAQDGVHALEVHEEFGPFDVILMDMRMPRMDGYTVVHKLREIGVETPIVACTANTYNEEIKRTRDVGCDDYLAKPFSRVALYRIVQQYLGVSSAALTPFQIPVELEDDVHTTRVIKGFQESLGDILQQLNSAWTVGDKKVLALIAHKLRAAQAFGFNRLSEDARKFEEKIDNIKPEDFAAFEHSIEQAQTQSFERKSLKQRVSSKK